MIGDEDIRGALLRQFDIRAAAFADDCGERAQGGAALAREETAILWELGASIAEALAAWAKLTGRLDLAREGSFDPRAGGELVIETLFDPILEPQACRVLTAALALAQ